MKPLENTQDSLRFYAGHPVEFAIDLIGVTPDKVQRDIMESVAANPMTTVRSGHGVGKSALQAWLVIWFLCTRPYPKIPCTAPTKHQLYDILWAEIAKWLNQSKLKDEVIWTQEKLYLRGNHENWFAVPRTATKPDALQGFHADNILYIIDEASGVDDKIFEPVLGALSTEGAKLLMCGNPTNLKGFFFDSHNKNRHMYAPYRISCVDSSRVSQEYIDTVIDMYGLDSDVYRVRVAGEFPKAMPDSFIPMDWAERNTGVQEAPGRIYTVDIGVDVARFGDDESVICAIANGEYQYPLEIYPMNDTMELTGYVVQAINTYNQLGARVRVKVDCDGLGVGVYDRLNELRPNCELFECHFGGRGGPVHDGEPVEMANTTGIMWGQVRHALKEDRLKLQPDDMMIEQLSNRRYRVNSDGKLVLERKEEMKKRGVSSPDRADALALAMYDANRGGQFVNVVF